MDVKNPNPSLRTRKILGIRIFAMEQDASGSWTGGIYNADDGQTYKGRLSPRGDDELEVQGCAGALCGSEVWTRASMTPHGICSEQKIPLRHRQHLGRRAGQQLAVGASPRRFPDRPRCRASRRCGSCSSCEMSRRVLDRDELLLDAELVAAGRP